MTPAQGGTSAAPAEGGRIPAAVTGDSLDRAGVLLQQAGFRRTHGRMALLAVLFDAAPEHLVAREIKRRVTAVGWPIDTSSLRRALADLEERRLVHTLPVPGPPVYGSAQPAHHHLVCRVCHIVTVVPAEDLAVLAEDVRTVIAAHTQVSVADFRPDHDGLSLHGRCAGCS